MHWWQTSETGTGSMTPLSRTRYRSCLAVRKSIIKNHKDGPTRWRIEITYEGDGFSLILTEFFHLRMVVSFLWSLLLPTPQLPPDLSWKVRTDTCFFIYQVSSLGYQVDRNFPKVNPLCDNPNCLWDPISLSYPWALQTFQLSLRPSQLPPRPFFRTADHIQLLFLS